MKIVEKAVPELRPIPQSFLTLHQRHAQALSGVPLPKNASRGRRGSRSGGIGDVLDQPLDAAEISENRAMRAELVSLMDVSPP